jgi:hypothetical protein
MDEGSDRVQATYPWLWEVARRLLRIDRDGGYAVDAEEWLTPPTTWGVWRRMAAGPAIHERHSGPGSAWSRDPLVCPPYSGAG